MPRQWKYNWDDEERDEPWLRSESGGGGGSAEGSDNQEWTNVQNANALGGQMIGGDIGSPGWYYGQPNSDVGASQAGLDETGGGGGDVGSSRQALDEPETEAGDVTQLDRDLAQIPIVGGWSRDKIAMAQDAREAERNRGYWHDLAATAPSVDSLTPQTFVEHNVDEYGNLIGDPSQLEGFGPSDDQRYSQGALRSLYESGGYTAADHNASRALRDQQAMQLGANNRAASQQMQARGMGGSGAELAMRQGASDSMAGANSMADAQLQQAAMQRALQGLQGYQSGANTQQSQELARRGALDAFNQQNNDWRRGRETRNTAWVNRGAENRTDAQQQAFDNRTTVAAGATNQYSTDLGGRNANRDRMNQRDQSLLGGLAELVDL